MRTVGVVVLTIAASTLMAVRAARAQDPVRVSPGLYKVLLENDQVRVLEFSLKPGQKEAMHSHRASVVYTLSDGKAKSTTPDGKSVIIESKAGQAVWAEPTTHAWESIAGDGHVIIVELKGSSAGPAKKKS